MLISGALSPFIRPNTEPGGARLFTFRGSNRTMSSPICVSELREIDRLANLNQLCVLDTCREEKFDKITELVRVVLDVPIAAVSLIDADRQWFKSIQGLDVTETPRQIAFCAHTILGQVPLNVSDAHADVRFRDNPLVTEEPHIRSYLGAPLRTSDGFNVGALCAIDCRVRHFGPAEEGLLARFAALVADELELRQIAQLDHLTGALSRRAFMQSFEAERTRRADGNGTSIVTFDIDHFKCVNDRYGHPGGDLVLKGVIEAAKLVLRRNDVIGRLGGEEFAILLPDCDRGSALSAAERSRAAFEKIRFESMPELRVSASFGVAMLGADRIETCLANADAALYMAKRTGRNRVVAFKDLLAKAA